MNRLATVQSYSSKEGKTLNNKTEIEIITHTHTHRNSRVEISME